jgi:transglutaminase-like putative cysteine protease
MFRLPLLILLLLSLPALASDNSSTWQFTYRILAGEFPSHEAVDVYLPLLVAGSRQTIVSSQHKSSITGLEELEPVHGNRVYHIHRPANINGPIDATLTWTVQVHAQRTGVSQPLSAQQREAYLSSNMLVPVGHALLQPILAEIASTATDQSDTSKANALYDWTINNMRDDTRGLGWGNGDVYWASTQRRGDCTDYSSLLIALSRSQGIPARFDAGFLLEGAVGENGSARFHCWAQLYVDGKWWAADPLYGQRQGLQLGQLPHKLIKMSSGRDIAVSEATGQGGINFFIAPHIEVGGKPWKVDTQTQLSARRID